MGGENKKYMNNSQKTEKEIIKDKAATRAKQRDKQRGRQMKTECRSAVTSKDLVAIQLLPFPQLVSINNI